MNLVGEIFSITACIKLLPCSKPDTLPKERLILSNLFIRTNATSSPSVTLIPVERNPAK